MAQAYLSAFLRKSSNTGTKGEIAWDKGDHVMCSTIEDTYEADVCPNPEMRLAKWLASRAGCDLDEAQSELCSSPK